MLTMNFMMNVSTRNGFMSPTGLVCILLSLMFAPASFSDQQQSNYLQKEAIYNYYAASPEVVRHQGQVEQVLFLTSDPSRVGKVFAAETSRLVLASITSQKKSSIVWQYDLPSGAGYALWWTPTRKEQDSAILVYLYSGECLTLDAPSDNLPVVRQKFSIDAPNGTMDLAVHHAFHVQDPISQSDHLFFSDNGLFDLALMTGKVNNLYSLPSPEMTFAHYLAVGDLNGDGTMNVVGDTSSTEFVNGKPVHAPSVVRVWHTMSTGHQQTYSSGPKNHWAIESTITKSSLSTLPTIVANELSENPSGGFDLYLHFYLWQNQTIKHITSSQGVVAPLIHDGFTLADLAGGGKTSVLALVSPADGGIHLAVLNLEQDKLIKTWISPRMHGRLRFGRVISDRQSHRQEVALVNPDTREVGLFKQSSNKFTGWESFRYLPPPPPPPKPLGIRFAWQQEDGLEPSDPARNFLMLDGNHLIQVTANDREINALYRTQQIQQRILDLAKQSFLPSQIVARKAGDEDEEPKMEVAAGKTIVIILTQSEAKAQGKTLPALAQEWVSAIRQVLTTLAKPPK